MKTREFVELELLLEESPDPNKQYLAYVTASKSGDKGAYLRLVWYYASRSRKQQEQLPAPPLKDLPVNFYDDSRLIRSRSERELVRSAWSNLPAWHRSIRNPSAEAADDSILAAER